MQTSAQHCQGFQRVLSAQIIGMRFDPLAQCLRRSLDFGQSPCRERLLKEPGVQQVNIEIVWDPVWTKARLTEEGFEILRTWGISA